MLAHVFDRSKFLLLSSLTLLRYLSTEPMRTTRGGGRGVVLRYRGLPANL